VQINGLCRCFSYDVTSLLAFGKSMQFLEGKSTPEAISVLENITNGMGGRGVLLQVPWLLSLIESLPFVGPLKGYTSWSAEQAGQVEHDTEIKEKVTIMGYLLKNTKTSATSRALLSADARLIMEAGSETVSSALIIIFILLATNPSHQHAIREEAIASLKDRTWNNAKPQPLLDDFVAECLRLFPPVTLSSQRVVPEGGLKLGKVFLPEDTIVNLATYQIQRGKFYAQIRWAGVWES
jgi:hypothetical protein